MNERRNNLTFVRFVAACIVVIGHAQAIVGHIQTQIFGGSVAVVGVMVFFAISGYLITDSWERNPSLGIFFANRCLRIFPALAVVTILTAFVLGPTITSLSVGDYFSNPNLLYFLRNLWLYTTYFLPSVFEHNPIPNAVNGSLWSLAPEFLCYTIVAAVGLSSPNLRGYAFFALFIGLAAACFYYPSYTGPQIVFYATDAFQAASVMMFFMVGAMIRLFRVPLNVYVAAALLVGYFLFPGGSPYVRLTLNWLVLSYFALSFGFASFPILNRWDRPGDFSYGIYLYAFPIQQTLWYLLDGRISAAEMIASSLVLSVAAGVGSWHLVEKHALKLKPRRRIKVGGAQPAAGLVIDGGEVPR